MDLVFWYLFFDMEKKMEKLLWLSFLISTKQQQKTEFYRDGGSPNPAMVRELGCWTCFLWLCLVHVIILLNHNTSTNEMDVLWVKGCNNIFRSLLKTRFKQDKVDLMCCYVSGCISSGLFLISKWIIIIIYFVILGHLAEAFVQSDLQ